MAGRTVLSVPEVALLAALVVATAPEVVFAVVAATVVVAAVVAVAMVAAAVVVLALEVEVASSPQAPSKRVAASIRPVELNNFLIIFKPVYPFCKLGPGKEELQS